MYSFVLSFLFRNGVISPGDKRIAPEHSPDCQKAPSERSKAFNSLQAIRRAWRCKAAAGSCVRRNKPLIKFYYKDQKPFHSYDTGLRKTFTQRFDQLVRFDKGSLCSCHYNNVISFWEFGKLTWIITERSSDNTPITASFDGIADFFACSYTITKNTQTISCNIYNNLRIYIAFFAFV